MRRLLLLSCTLILILCGCKNKNKNTSTVSAQDTVMTVTSLLTDTAVSYTHLTLPTNREV